jgi:predicted amidohydrolase YtcJ
MTNPSPTIYTNCTIITGDTSRPRAETMAVVNGSIAWVGDETDLGSLASSGAHRIDLTGATVVPGFDDCHMHVLSLGLTLGQVNCRPDAAPTIGAIQELVACRSAQLPDGHWVMGRGYNQNLLAERRHPTRHDLDGVSAGHPVLLGHTSGHVVTVNSTALGLAGVTAATVDPPGGEIERDESGEPTGVLKETARELVYSVVPPLTHSEMRDAILIASETLAREGITSASDAATGQHAGLTAELAAYRAAFESGRPRTRLTLMPVIQEVMPEAGSDRALSPTDLDAGSEPDWLRIGAVKIFSDGALTTRTAAMREPYLGSGGLGILTWEPDHLRQMIVAAAGRGWQIATHAIGDRAISEVLAAYEAIPRDVSAARHRIEHCTICDADLIERMKRRNIVAVLQPEDIAVLGDAYPLSLGNARAQANSPVGWFAKKGLPIAFSSDRPVTPGHPLAGVIAAVERRTASGDVLGLAHRISAESAITYYTRGSAYATFAESYNGVLKPGFKADFVVLDTDVTRCAPEQITEAKVLMTVVDGRVTFEGSGDR